MFGHDDHDNQDENNKPEGGQQPGDKPAEEVFEPSDNPKDDGWQHPGPPPSDDDDDSDDKPAESEDSSPESSDSPADNFSIGQNKPDGDNVSDNDLIDLKQEALNKLSPLVGHLDQSPDEKFRTLMMMIQASDDQNMVREAYETALKINDEKERAQALLDIVNEINYFTQSQQSN